jgi:flagellar P-ring protein precursor FlgI
MSLKHMHKGILTGVSMVLLAALFLPAAVGAARIKDIASIGGIRDNQLVGYGLVVGLMNSGDSIKNGFTKETLSNMLSRQGLAMRDKDLKSNNIAAVMVTAVLPPFAKTGAKLDVMVSSLGDAKSLLGGTLLMTPLRGANNDIYAVAQGAVTIGGFMAGGNSGSAVGKNHTTVGYITNGALIEKELQYDFEKTRQLTVNLFQPDFTTLNRLASTVNSRIGDVDVKLVDSGSALVTVKDTYKGSIVSLLSALENLDVSVDTPAIVVMNEKTGTVVMGENVRISTIAVAHGNLSFQIKEDYNVSQPLPFAPGGTPGQAPVAAGRGVTMGSGGQTVVTPSTQINVSEEKKALTVMARGITIQDVVRGLNAMGVTPRDLIQILQTIKAAGALQADLKIM